MPRKQALKSRILDKTDRKILMILQENCRESLTNIAKKVGLSIDSVNKRMKEMTAKGVYEPTILINPRIIGFDIVADIKIKLKNVTEEDKRKFIGFLKEYDRCTELLEVMGDWDFTCVLIAKDSNELTAISTEIRQRFSNLIADWKGIFVMKLHKFEEYKL
ncbi:Lrp/AsnC family transcriptional regulator [Candidatus Woesearchaeota archaeon]|nr:Lrp/AsnC family transcriptional regulator [Candidatus Woesearchaeota archaeon]